MSNVPLDTRFIGISPDVNLYERKTSLLNAQTQPYTMQDIINTAGGGGATAITKAELDTLISTDGLTPGAYYIISGVDVPLYGGTTVILQAETTNKLALAGHGIFYNPKYLNSQATPNNGYGIWSNYISLTFSNIVGTFTSGQTVTANNGATATYLAQGFLSWISGDWSLATSINNGSGATADVSGGVSPSYAIGQDVIWGGKHWTNTSGNVGTAIDKYTLSSADWTAVPFNSTDYNVEIDVIHYDYIHDMIIRRKDRWNNDVDGNFQIFDEFASSNGFDFGNPIKDFQWGNGPDDWNTDDYEFVGVFGNYVKDSYFECINFIGRYLAYNISTQNSYMHSNITDVNSYISYNTLSQYSNIIDNVLYNNSRIFFNTLGIYSNINGNILDNNVEISNNIIEINGKIQFNTIYYYSTISRNILSSFLSNIYSNTVSYGSDITQNELINGAIGANVLIGGYIQNNKMKDNSSIINNIVNGSTVNSNMISNNSYIDSNTVNNSSNISFNTISVGSQIFNNTLNGSSSGINANMLITNSFIQNSTFEVGNSINNNILRSSTFGFPSFGVLQVIQYIEANYATATSNISSATIIYGNYSKQMFRNSAGVTQLGYYNASNVFTVVNVNA
jgi:hypothetical protein